MTDILLSFGGTFRSEPGKWVAEISGEFDDRFGTGDTRAQALRTLGELLDEEER